MSPAASFVNARTFCKNLLGRFLQIPKPPGRVPHPSWKIPAEGLCTDKMSVGLTQGDMFLGADTCCVSCIHGYIQTLQHCINLGCENGLHVDQRCSSSTVNHNPNGRQSARTAPTQDILVTADDHPPGAVNLGKPALQMPFFSTPPLQYGQRLVGVPYQGQDAAAMGVPSSAQKCSQVQERSMT